MASDYVSDLVSIIIPVHNRFNLTDESVRSVYEQTYRPIELIIVDDLSGDSYKPCIASEQGFEVKMIRHEENKGPGASRETGRLEAQGEFIAYLDSDDLWLPQCLELQVRMLKKNQDAQMSYCKTALFNDPSELDHVNLRRRNDQNFDKILPTLFWGRPWSTSSCVWTRKAVDLIGPWFSGYTWEDLDYDFRAGIKQIKLCHVPQVLCYKREDTGIEQLSRIPKEKEICQRFDSVIAIAKAVKQNKKSLDKKILILFVKKVFRPLLIQLVEMKHYDKAQILCRDMVRVSPLFSQQRGITIFLHILSNFLPIEIFKSLFLKLCTHLT